MTHFATATNPASPTSSTPGGSPPITKTAAISAALDAHPDKTPKEIAEIMQAEGWDIDSRSIRGVKSKRKDRKMRGANRRPAQVPARGPVVRSVPPATLAVDDVSFDALIQAKRLAEQLGGVREAKAAIAALAELVD